VVGGRGYGRRVSLDTLRVVAGNPTEDEIQAVRLAIIHVVSVSRRRSGPVEPGSWSDPDESLRRAPVGNAAGQRYGWASTVW